MPSGCLKQTVLTIIHPIDSFDPKWTKDKLDKWIAHAGGRALIKFTTNTTHVICTEKAWKNHSGEVRLAVEARNSGERVHIVSPEWLQETLTEQRRAKEGQYSWEKMDKIAVLGRKRGAKEAARAEREAVGGVRTQSGMLAEAFQEHTESFLSEEEKQKLREGIERERQAARLAGLAEEKEKREKVEEEKRKRKKQEAIFRKGAKKARNEIFSDNHHIYMDSTGFKYEVTLTKVDTKHNRNERYVLTLQLYESDPLPPTYATNLHFAGTHLVPSNNIIAALGCTFPTALHAFKKVFREKTRVEWDDRIAFAVERRERELREMGVGTGSPEGMQHGRAISETELEGMEKGFRAMGEVAFSRQAFVYHPPLYGARGVLPERAREVFPKIGPPIAAQASHKGVEDIELGPSGANGAGPSPDAGETGAEGEGVGAAEMTDGGSQAGAEQTGMSDFDHFISGAYAAAAGGEGSVVGDLADLGDTDHPFAGDGVDFNAQNALDDAKAAEHTEHTSTGEAMHTDDEQIQQPVPETVAETQSFNATQMAENAAAGLQSFTSEVQDAARAASPPATAPTTSQNVNLGTSILGKRKTWPAQDDAAAAEKKRDTESHEAFYDALDGGAGVGEEASYHLGSGEGRVEGGVPRAHPVDDEAAEYAHLSVEEQIERETQQQAHGGEGEGVEVEAGGQDVAD